MSYSPVYKWRMIAEDLVKKLGKVTDRYEIELIDCAEKFEFDQEKAHFKLALETTDELDQDCGLSLIVDVPNAQAWLSNGLNRVGDINIIEVKLN